MRQVSVLLLLFGKISFLVNASSIIKIQVALHRILKFYDLIYNYLSVFAHFNYVSFYKLNDNHFLFIYFYKEIIMVLERHPKKFKHLIRTMLSQLVQHENITTTRAKAKHLRPYAQKLLSFAKRAHQGEKSPLNLLKGRVHTKKIQTKLLVDLIPRIKDIRGGFIRIKNLQTRRRGDNAPMSQIYIKGNQKTEIQNKRNQEALRQSKVPSLKQFKSKILNQQIEIMQRGIKEAPHMQHFYKQKLELIKFRQWELEKNPKEPPKYSLLI